MKTRIEFLNAADEIIHKVLVEGDLEEHADGIIKIGMLWSVEVVDFRIVEVE